MLIFPNQIRPQWINSILRNYDIPALGRLIVYMGDSKYLSKELLQEFMDEVEKGKMTEALKNDGERKKMINLYIESCQKEEI